MPKLIKYGEWAEMRRENCLMDAYKCDNTDCIWQSYNVYIREVLKQICEKKGGEFMPKFYVDLSCYDIEAESQEDACQIVEARIKGGELPEICNVEEHED